MSNNHSFQQTSRPAVFYLKNEEITIAQDPLNELFSNWNKWFGTLALKLQILGVTFNEDASIAFQRKKRINFFQ